MKTTYAVAFTVDDSTEKTRLTIIDTISDWLADRFPLDERPPGTFVRAREGTHDPVFRLSIDESAPNSTHTSSFTVTVFVDKNKLMFDARSVAIPRGDRVMPKKALELPRDLVVTLVTNVLERVKVYDANERLTAHAIRARTEMEGGAIGALINASGRRLPLLVEVVDFASRGQSILDSHVSALAGIAHVRVIDTAEALEGFSTYGGDSLIMPGDVKVYWAGGLDKRFFTTRSLAQASVDSHRNFVLSSVIDTAALALAPVSVPPPPLTDDLDDDDTVDRDESNRGDDSTVSVDTSGATDSSHVDLAEVYAQYADYERQIAELQATMADADRIIAEQQEEIARRRGQVDELVLYKVHLETNPGAMLRLNSIRSVKEAVRMAREKCENLTFHERAIESAETLEISQPSRVLEDLILLDEVARKWRTEEIVGSSFAIACRDKGLNYAAGISDQARQKYTDDYEIEWRGRKVLAEAHIKRGKGSHLYRIHLYLDNETEQVVVAYIGRHLRGKRDAR